MTHVSVECGSLTQCEMRAALCLIASILFKTIIRDSFLSTACLAIYFFDPMMIDKYNKALVLLLDTIQNKPHFPLSETETTSKIIAAIDVTQNVLFIRQNLVVSRACNLLL